VTINQRLYFRSYHSVSYEVHESKNAQKQAQQAKQALQYYTNMKYTMRLN